MENDLKDKTSPKTFQSKLPDKTINSVLANKTIWNPKKPYEALRHPKEL